MRRLRSIPFAMCALAGLASLASPARAGDPAPLVANGDLTAWATPAAPDGWRVAVGSNAGPGPSSTVTRGADGGVRLEGNAKTTTWALVEQPVTLHPGSTYRLSFEARVIGARLDPGQRDNGYVGVRLPPATATASPTFVTDAALRDVWTPGEVLFRAKTAGAEVAIFLSKTGALEARRIVLEELSKSDSFDVLSRQLSRYYSYFATKKIDPATLLAKHRAAFPADGEPAAFAEAARGMLAELDDLHVSIRLDDGRVIYPAQGSVPKTYDFRAVAGKLRGAKQIGRIGLVGEVDDELGYIAVGALDGQDLVHAQIEEALRSLAAQKAGIILDLRSNGGGDERRALALAAILCDAPHAYARRRVRSGPAPTDLSEPASAWVRPVEGSSYRKPVVVLIGPSCVSSGEGFAKMMASMPHVELMGQPTRGASGNPAPSDLPNGISVRFSRWVDELPDGTPTEGVGVIPKVLVAYKGAGDPTFEAGVARLKALVAK